MISCLSLVSLLKLTYLYRLVAFFIIGLLPGLLPAQDNIAFHHITTVNGLTDNNVTCAVIDKRGVLWIGTSEGLNSYDGREMRNYFKEHIPALGNNNIREILSDRHNRLWVRSFGGHIAMLDDDGKWHNILVRHKRDTVAIDNMVETKTRGIVLFKGKRQFVLAKNDTSFVRWYFGDDPIFERRLQYYSHLSEDEVIWTTMDELFIMNYATGKVSFRKTIPGITSATALNRNELYITTAETGGLFKLDLSTGAITSLSHLKDQYGNSIFGSLQMARKMADNRVIITAAFAGLYIYDPGTGKLSRFTHDPLSNSSVSGYNYRNLVTDTSGYVLIGSPTSGLSYFNMRNKSATLVSAVSNEKGEIFDGYVNTILSANDEGIFWLGCYNQLIQWNKKTGKAIFFSYGTGLNSYPNKDNDGVETLCKDDAGRIWVGTGNNGIVILDSKGKLAKQVNRKNAKLPSDKIHHLLHDKGKIWIGTDSGVCLADAISGMLIPIDTGIALHKVGKKPVSRIWKDKNNKLWLGMIREGAYCYDPSKNSLKNVTGNRDGTNLQVFAFEEDDNGNTYLGTSAGLQVVKDDRVVNTYTRLNGFRSDRCENILKDARGDLWIGNHNCIIRFDPTERYFWIFDEKSGLSPLGLRPGGAYKDENGFFYFGCEKGFNYFQPDAISVPQEDLKLSVIGLQTGDSELVIRGPQPVVLPYNNNNVAFHLSVIDLEQSKNIFYRYRLKGYDDQWMGEANIRNLRYNALPPGNYLFEAAASSDGIKWVKSRHPVNLIIEPAIWQTEWFRFGTALVLAAIFYFTLKRRERNIKLKAQEKARLEEMRSQALQYQLEIEQVINYFANSLIGLFTVEEILWDVVKTCISQLDFQDCVIYLYNSDKTMLVQKAAYGPKNIDYKEVYNRLEIPLGSGVVGHVAQTGVAEIIGDTSADPRYIPDDAVRLSEIAIPLIGSDGVMGVIDSEHPDPGFYNNRHLQILTAIAAMVVNKLEQLEAEAENRQKEVEMARLQRDVATLQLTATRAQMNPHFIFNALNSVQQYILQGNTDEANKYLSRFSRLQREILNHCDRAFITLQKEMDMLRMYLQLEQLRFNGSFDFTISVDEELDADEIKIPPMILQPFVENAIWHGLMPKEGNRKVSVCFKLDEETETLHCTISDNGIGRQAAADKKYNGDYVSKGLSLVHKRLELLQEQMGRSFTSQIDDLVDREGRSAGTRVEVTMFTGF